VELWRRAASPWGQDVLIGVSWDLMWLAVCAAAAFLAGHAVWAWARNRHARASGVAAGAGSEGKSAPEAALPSPAAGLPERITRHGLPARIFHWTMAASMLVLLATAFVPVMGWQFPWVTIHWVAGFVLLGCVVFHVFHALGRGRFWEMMRVGASEGMAMARHVMSPRVPTPPKAGKYPFDHRLFHNAIVVVGLGVIVTGVLMAFRLDTWFWSANPYFLSDAAWGVVYVVHGLFGVSLIFFTAAHIYFALRPDKFWLTWSMIRGWIGRDRYLAHYDPSKWVVEGSAKAVREADDGRA